MTSFMQPQMTSQQWWFYFETKSEGTTWVPAEWFSPDSLAKELGDDLVGSIGVTAGYGVRRSAPGYMDCTPWDVYGDEDDAQAAFDELVAEDREAEAEAEDSSQGPPPGSRYAPLVASDFYGE